MFNVRTMESTSLAVILLCYYHIIVYYIGNRCLRMHTFNIKPYGTTELNVKNFLL